MNEEDQSTSNGVAEAQSWGEGRFQTSNRNKIQ